MRGKDLLVVQPCTANGITPAYAGKRSSRRSAMHRKRDHPRLCGEKVLDHYFGIKSVGSPPPMRGKDGENVVMQGYPGITPAYAGKSSYDFSRFFFV